MKHRVQMQRFHAYPLAQLATAFGLGILGAHNLVISLRLVASIAGLLMFFTVAALLRQRRTTATIFTTALALFLGFAAAVVEQTHQPPTRLKQLLEMEHGPTEQAIVVGQPVEITGVLERDPETTPERWFLNLRIEGLRSRGIERTASGIVMLLIPVATESTEQELERIDLRYGARIRVMTRLERSDAFRNPGVAPFAEYLDRKGYDATGFVKSPLLIERLENTPVFLPLASLYEWRRNLQSEINARFSRETAGVLDAAFLGNRYNLSRETAGRFREGGTFHVLVISGLHITFLGGLVFLSARRFTKNNAARFLLSVAVVWGYSLAVGAESSVMRASLMFTIVVLAPMVGRRASSLNAAGGAALVLLVWRPSDLFDPSFQLTFISVLAMVVLAWPLLQKAAEIGSWRPTHETPYPPQVASWLRTLCEIIFWSEREWQLELKRTSYTCKLFKSPLAAKLERYRLQRLMRYMFAAVLVSVSVQLALLPLLVVYFHRLSFASFVLNIGVSLMMAGVALAGALGLLLTQISSTLAAPLINLTNALNWLMVHSVDPFAHAGVAAVRLPEYSGWASAVYGFYYVPLIALSVLLARWQPMALARGSFRSLHSLLHPLRFFARPSRSLRLAQHEEADKIAKDLKGIAKHAKRRFGMRRITQLTSLAQTLAVALIIFHPFSEAAPDGKLRVDFLDVGQGDAALVTMPDNTTLLIDGGGKPGPFPNEMDAADDDDSFERDSRGIGEAVVSEYLWWRGLDHVDYLLATHADADHIDGLNDVMRNFSVRAALVARTPNRDPEYAKFLNSLAATGTSVETVGAGDVLRFGAVVADVLWPLPANNRDAPSGNNDSVVLRFSFGERSILLTADIEKAAENALVERNRRGEPSQQTKANFNLRADVVKVAHHGSKSSSSEDFIAATQAGQAIISVGQTSIFGHPHPEVVRRWQASGAEVLTTGERGTITVTTDGRELRVSTYVKK